MVAREVAVLLAGIGRFLGRAQQKGPADGPPLMVIPGFLANDRSTSGLQRALAGAGYRVAGWGLGLNRGVRADTIDRLVERIAAFGGGGKVILVGWSLGGVYAREAAKARPDLAAAVVTLGAPFSGDRKSNNAWRLYELVARHKVDRPPFEAATEEKPPVRTLALWSRRDGIVAAASARGRDGERDDHVELGCTHMGFAMSKRAFPEIVAAVGRCHGASRES